MPNRGPPLGRAVRRRNKGAERQVALQRIRRLIELAGPAEAERARRYVRLARRIGMRYQVSLPREVRRRVCRECDALLVPGRTARVRTTDGRVSVTCLACGTVKRYPYARAATVTA
jgi:ribonuclease P protein subunit RPR2